MKFKKNILKYLLEIVIIIIGVVIAFYLTRYGDNLKRSQDEDDVINQIYFELKNNLNDLEADFQIHRAGLLGNLRAIKFTDSKEALSDSLIMDFYWMTRDEYIFPNRSGYDNLESFGVNLIKDDSLRTLITLLYNHNFPRLSKGNTLYPDINEYLTPFFKDHFRVNRDTSLEYTMVFRDSFEVTYPLDIGLGVKQLVGYIPIDTEALRVNEEFRFLISKSLEFRMYKYQFYQNSINSVKMAMGMIEERE